MKNLLLLLISILLISCENPDCPCKISQIKIVQRAKGPCVYLIKAVGEDGFSFKFYTADTSYKIGQVILK